MEEGGQAISQLSGPFHAVRVPIRGGREGGKKRPFRDKREKKLASFIRAEMPSPLNLIACEQVSPYRYLPRHLERPR